VDERRRARRWSSSPPAGRRAGSPTRSRRWSPAGSSGPGPATPDRRRNPTA